MAFGDLQSRDGLVLLNKFLVDKSYIEGCVFSFLPVFQKLTFHLLNRYCPTQCDLAVFEAVKKAPSADLENALRWYKHIASFNDAEKQKYSCCCFFVSYCLLRTNLEI
jgi:elongation factor 1-beta